jgi:hypothetical protein
LLFVVVGVVVVVVVVVVGESVLLWPCRYCRDPKAARLLEWKHVGSIFKACWRLR